MKNRNRALLIFFLYLVSWIMMPSVLAGTPVWTFVPLTPTTLTLVSNSQATVIYKVTNQSYRPKVLLMKPIPGITQLAPCSMSGKGSCILTLAIQEAKMVESIIGGPVLCEKGNNLQCYQPSVSDILRITVSSKKPSRIRFTITPVAGVNGSINPSKPVEVRRNSSVAFTATPKAGFSVDKWLVDNKVAQSGGTSFQLTNITADHTVAARFIAQYTLTPSSGANGSISPSSPQTVNAGSAYTFTATPASGYGPDKWRLDGAVVQHGGSTYTLKKIKANHSINVTFATTTLSASVANLAVAVSGQQRNIIITNEGSTPTTNLQVAFSNFPLGTNVTNNCPAVLGGGLYCTITIKPGINASSGGNPLSSCTNGNAPNPGDVVVTADNANTTNISGVVLGSKCIYQSGYVFAIDDTTPITQSIGGKVVALQDQVSNAGVSWDATCYDPNNLGLVCTILTNAKDVNLGENLESVPGSINPPQPGQTNGPGDTWQIIDALITNGPTPNPNTESPANFAAGFCTSYNGGGFSDWYLPAICEMGSGGNNYTSCPSNQNINSINILGNDNYWSSTECQNLNFCTNFANSAVGFVPGFGQYPSVKGETFAVRCARLITQP